MSQALDVVDERKKTGLASGKLNYKSPPSRPDLCAEIMANMRAREERDNGLFASVQCSMTYDQLPAAEQRLASAKAGDNEEGKARATRALATLLEEIDAWCSINCICAH